MNKEHGGNICKLAEQANCKPEQLLDFSSSINPFGPPEFLRPSVSRALDNIIHYPAPKAEKLIYAAAEAYKVDKQCILAANGSEEIIYSIPRAFKCKKALILAPSYIDYEKSCQLAGLEIQHFYLEETADFIPDFKKLDETVEPESLVFIARPGNPAGTAMSKVELLKLIKKHPDSIFIVDEAFAEFQTDEFSMLPEILPNMLILRSMTKFYAIPGLRLGLAFGSAENIASISEQLPPWTVNTIAQELGTKILENSKEYQKETREFIDTQKKLLIPKLEKLGIKVFPGLANYLLCKLPEINDDLYSKLLKQYRIAIRNCKDFEGLNSQFFRIAIKTQAENEYLLDSFKKVLGQKNESGVFYFKQKKKTPSLMIQGTCSNAGKSVLVSAFCRILLQDGYNVAPFKSQNMALNSYVTADGCEIGRAQAVQAQACRLAPDIRMNPVLLKPSTDTGCQVILMGKPIQNMEAKRYFRYKKDLFVKVKKAYDSLASDYDAIILEGAGSPGEVNLKKHDIVNMNMARYAQSPVLLAGDIDRGGTYASFIGSLETFLPWERELLKGFLVNKFRGDASLLKDAHDYVEDFTGKPVLGVIPYLADMGIPEEDSVSFALTRPCKKLEETLDVALIELQHISNFTDFTPFEIEPDVNIRKVRHARDLGSPDLIIMPGSKNVIGDLISLKERGMADAVIDQVNNGAWYVGICGGLQIAGDIIKDPLGLESSQPEIEGLKLLPLTTVLEAGKCLNQTQGKLLRDNQKVSGYEIHHGKTEFKNDNIVSMLSESGEAIGFADGKVWLTYLHGVFDDDQFRRSFIDMVKVERGLKPMKSIQATYDIDKSIDRLAAHVRNNVEMEKIYKITGLK